mgnify:FL=1
MRVTAGCGKSALPAVMFIGYAAARGLFARLQAGTFIGAVIQSSDISNFIF